MEIMLVVVIIGILAALVMPRLVGRVGVAKSNAARTQLKAVETALGLFEQAAGGFPSTSEGLQALVVKPGSITDADWPKGGFLDKVPIDPWGQAYHYANPPEHGKDYDLSSNGPDRQQGTADDITNWEDTPAGGGKL